MKLHKAYIITGALVGGLLLSAATFKPTVYAMCNSSSNVNNYNNSSNNQVPTGNSTQTPAGNTLNNSETNQNDPASVVTTIPNDATSDTSGSNDPSNNDATVNNVIQGDAQSGNATVANSNLGGNATTGSSSDTANLVNSIQSSSNLSGDGLQTFTDNINGNYAGNLNIDPTNYVSSSSTSSQTPVSDNLGNSGTIDNTVDLAATTGNATVENNAQAGSATTGNASAEANIVNLINSSIADNQSFLGIVNIYGNLDGNIYLPSDLVSGLLGSPTNINSANATINNTNNEEINNEVTLLAQSGQAGVISNSIAGNAISGNASTNLNLYNLTNSEIVGGNLLLVFVNVSGNWVGLLFNSPSGTTSAALGGGIQQNDQIIPNSNGINTTNNESINNYLYLNATSGNALVTYNDKAGNASSGNATSNADIVNILGDQVDLTGWLGILIINVYGSWNGSLLVQPTTTTTSLTTSNTVEYVTIITTKKDNNNCSKLFYKFSGLSNQPAAPASHNTQTSQIVTAASGHKKLGINNFATTVPANNQIKKDSNLNLIIGAIGFAVAGVAIAGERIASSRMKP